MKFGLCVNFEEANLLESWGYDYGEASVSNVRPDQSEEVFKERLALIRGRKLRFEAFNVFVPAQIKITGPDRDLKKLEAHVSVALRRIKEAGAEIIVFGSGGARKCPDGFNHEQARTQIIEFLQMTSVHLDKNELQLVIEPLNQGEDNMINTYAQGVEIARKVNHRRITVLADLYHVELEKEPWENIISNAGVLDHVHIADAGRFEPGTGDWDIQGFFRALKKAGYNKRISFEGKWKDFQNQGPKVIQLMRNWWQAA